MNKIAVHLTIVVFAISSVTSLIRRQQQTRTEIETNLSELERQLPELQSFSQIDQLRRKNKDKVIALIDLYNPSIPDDTKDKIASTISDLSMKYDNLDVDLICATITHESAFSWDPKVESHAGAMGLMQIMPSTGAFLAKFENIPWTTPEKVLFDPVINIRLGCRYLSSLIELYEIDGGLAAYNGGGRIVLKWLANNKADGILYKETQNYVPSVLSLYNQYKN
ncbi:MAG: lytic transglycosylase domain-containing protein [bacterium]